MQIKFDKHKIFVISVIIICIICINLAILSQVTNTNTKENRETIVVDVAKLTENFSNIFNNSIDYQNNNVNIQKQDINKELVSISYSKKQEIENYYDITVNIPQININTKNVNKINSEIKNLFQQKVNSIITKKDMYYIYNVQYKAYINDNILSLIIMSSLKEGNNSQRVIVKTYNYNITSDEIIDINQLLNFRNLERNYVQTKINEVIKNASKTALEYKELGYNKYLRDINDSMYKIENSSVFFIGQDKALYILYPYGNTSYTSELDIVVM